MKSWKKRCSLAAFGTYLSYHLHRSLTIQTKDYNVTYFNASVLFAIGVIGAGAFIWLYNRTFEQRHWTKRVKSKRNFDEDGVSRCGVVA